MSILDDAIREHLELKRAHGADEAELKRLEDEAFGPPGRPDEEDSLSEAQTEFLAAPATEAADVATEAKAATAGRPAPNIADLQEAPEPSKAEPEAEAPPEVDAAEPEPSGPSTEERHAISSQPTELFDVEAEIDAGTEKESPSDEELLDSQLAEPRLAPTEPASSGEPSTPPKATESAAPDAVDEDDFFSEQRLSDELNQALEAPVTDEEPVPDLPSEEYEHEPHPETGEHETATEPPSEEHTEVYDHRSEPGEEDSSEERYEKDEAPAPEQPEERRARDSEDVLEDTPDFLEDAPEDDELWFEQKPPKDFDFDD